MCCIATKFGFYVSVIDGNQKDLLKSLGQAELPNREKTALSC